MGASGNMGFKFWTIDFIVGAEYIINDTGFRNQVLPPDTKVLYPVLLHKPSGLYFSKATQHFAKLAEVYQIGEIGKIGFVEISSFHLQSAFQYYLSMSIRADML